MTARILYDNKADTATLTASSEAGSLVVANLLTDIKSEVWRSDTDTGAITAVWTDPIYANMAALPFCNLKSTATIRARGYTNAGDASPAVDTGAVLACAYEPLGNWWGTRPLGVNAFSYGGGAYARVYFTGTTIRKLVIDIDDTGNPAGYIEAARLVTGAYWSPAFNPGYGFELAMGDDSKHERDDGGNLRTSRGASFRTLPIPLEYMQTADRARLYEIKRGNGMARPVFVSLFPGNNADPQLEQAHQIYGKLVSPGGIALPMFNTYSGALEVQEI